MADYIPTTDFVFSAGTYTPSTTFDFNTAIEDIVGDFAWTLDDVVGDFAAAIIPIGSFAVALDDATGSFVGLIDVALIGAFDVQLDSVTGTFVAKNIVNSGGFNFVLDDAVGGFIGNYDPNIIRFTTAINCSLNQDTSQLAPVKLALMRDQAPRTDSQTIDQQIDASFIHSIIELSNNNATFTSIDKCSLQAMASSVSFGTKLVREQGTFIEFAACFKYESASDVRIASAVVMEQMTKIYPERWVAPIQDSGVVQHDFLHLFYLEPPAEYRYTPNTNFNFVADESYVPDSVYEFLWGQTDYLATGHNFGIARNSFNSTWNKATPSKIRRCVPVDEARRPPRGKTPWVDPPRPDPIPDPPSGNTIIVPIKEAYTMQNTMTVTLEDLTPINMDRVSLKFDAESFAWQFSGTLLDHAQLPLVKKLTDGSTIKLIITINGKVFHVFVEQKAQKRSFGKREITLSGRSLSAQLAWPYYQPLTGTQGSLLSNQQLADLHLPAGWTNNWQAVIWNVTAGAYSYQDRTPIQAIADIATAMGAMIVPSTDSQVLNIKPRYPVLPWNFDSTAVDVAIPEAAIIELTERDTSRQYANGIYIHGGDIGGMLGFCRLSGTAGDVLLQTVSNPIMTDVIGLRAAGERYLAGEYIQPDISSIKTAMDGIDIPFIDVGTFVGVTVDGVEVKAIVSAVSIEVSLPSVTQEITLGEDTKNSWVAFKSLLPKDPLLVGTIQSTDGVTSTILLIDGGIVNVRGTGTVSTKVYIRSGQIQGEAPNMVQNDIVI